MAQSKLCNLYLEYAVVVKHQPIRSESAILSQYLQPNLKILETPM